MKIVHLHYERRRWMFTLENPKWEKPREPTNSEMITIEEEEQWETRRQLPRALCLCQPAVTTKKTNSLSLSLSPCILIGMHLDDELHLVYK